MRSVWVGRDHGEEADGQHGTPQDDKEKFTTKGGRRRKVAAGRQGRLKDDKEESTADPGRYGRVRSVCVGWTTRREEAVGQQHGMHKEDKGLKDDKEE